MAKNIISSYDRFADGFTELTNSGANGSNQRLDSLKRYFARGGVISVTKTKKGSWPKLLYPGERRIKDQIKDVNSLKQLYASKQKDWERSLLEARLYGLKNNVMKFSEPTYWKHILKKIVDADYRQDAGKVNLPAHLVTDSRWKPMIKMFVNEIDYRKQLTETVENSIVYKKDKRVAKYANLLNSFRQDMSKKKTENLQQKIEELNKDIRMLNEILKWTKES